MNRFSSKVLLVVLLCCLALLPSLGRAERMAAPGSVRVARAAADTARSATLERALTDAITRFLGRRYADIELEHLRFDEVTLTLDLSSDAKRLVGQIAFEDFMSGINRVVNDVLDAHGRDKQRSFDYIMLIAGKPLRLASPPPQRRPPNAPAGVVGHRVALSPGHGRYRDAAGKWSLQRSVFNGIVEDFINADLVIELDQRVRARGLMTLPARELDTTVGAHASGYPWWEMGASEYVRSLGAPETVWNGGSNGLSSDIYARPRYATWAGAEALVSIHNNGGGGCGTEVLYDTANGFQTQSRQLADLVKTRLIERLREEWNGAWCDRGVKGFNGTYAENREFAGPAIIVELAFMDNPTDNAALQNARFRSIATAAIDDAIAEFMNLAPQARLFLSPQQQTVEQGTQFSVDLEVDAGTGLVDTVDAYLSFDPAALEVVDAGGMPANEIELNGEVFSGASINAVDNTTGRIDFSATKTTAPALTGAFRAATVRFRAKTANEHSSIEFVQTGTRTSDLYYGGFSVEPLITGATMTVDATVMLDGHVNLLARGEPGTPRWEMPLFRQRTDDSIPGITVLEAGTNRVVAQAQTTTDQMGNFSVDLPGVAHGDYDLVVKGSNTLSIIKRQVRLPSTNRVEIGTLPIGDTNGDNKVNGADVSYLIPVFLSASTTPAFCADCDVNGDGRINGADVSALIPNFLRSGAIEAIIQPVQRASRATASRVWVSTNAQTIRAGEVATATVEVDVGTGRLDTVDVFLDFDPYAFEVVGGQRGVVVNADAFDAMTYRAVNSTHGRIDLSVSRTGRSPLSGHVRIATLYLRAKQQLETFDLRFSHEDLRASNLYLAGTPLATRFRDANAAPNETHHVYLPLVGAHTP